MFSSSDSIKEISQALVNSQKEMTVAVKDSANPYFKSKYADLNAIREAVIPALNKNAISVLQPIIQKDSKTFVRTMLLHTSGEFLSSDTEVLTAKANDPQAYGSGISYARRYGLQALLCVGAADDDGEAAMARDTSPKPTETPAPPRSSFKKSDDAGKNSKKQEGWT